MARFADAKTRALWRKAAVQTGVIAVPAGFNYLTSGTTEWLYDQDDLRTDAPLELTGTGLRVPLDVEGVTQHLALLRIVDALWERVSPPARIHPPHGFLRRLDSIGLPRETFDLRRFLQRSAIALDWIGLFDEYASGGYYHHDFFNGIAFWLTRARPRSRGPRRPRRRS